MQQRRGERSCARFYRAAVRDRARRRRRPGDRGRSGSTTAARPALAHPAAPRSRSASSVSDVIGERAGVAERRQQPDVVAVDDVAHAADVGADAGHAGGQAFDQRDRRAFVARGQQEDVGGARRWSSRSRRQPRKRTRSAMPSARACASSSARSSPSPAIRNSASGSASAHERAVSRNSACCLIAVSRPTVVTRAPRPECPAPSRAAARAASSIAASASQIEAERDDAVLLRHGRCGSSSSSSSRICGEIATMRSVTRRQRALDADEHAASSPG